MKEGLRAKEEARLSDAKELVRGGSLEDATNGNRADKSSLLIVGIGASAGGLEAFKTFFENMPPQSGMAFILIQHLSPHHRSMLVEILAKSTSMIVVEAVDGAEVLPDHVFVIPPDSTLTMANGRLLVVKPAPPREHRRPIDTFFFSLAEDQAENAVCVILSGTGSDGAMGLASIKENGGITIAQAEFDHHAKSGMPSSAAATGFVDYVMQVKDIPAKLVEYRRHLHQARVHKVEDGIRVDVPEHLAEISALLRKGVGHDFTEYKDKTVVRRVQRRMQVLQLGNVKAYIEVLRANPRELDLLFRDLLIGVTQFFRDPTAFEALEAQIVPRLIEGKGASDHLRIWVPGCATGEEAYSIAILLIEAITPLPAKPKIMIFATDIDDRSLGVARQGRYLRAQLKSVTPQRLERWFSREGDYYVVVPELRAMCVFSTHSVLRDPPFSKLALISCRNLLIYLDATLQDRLIPLFHYALQPGGFLFLGSSESIGRRDDFFAEVDKNHRLFRRRDETPAMLPTLPLSDSLPKNFVSPRRLPNRPATENGIQRGARRVIERYSPAHLLIDKSHQVLSFSEQTGRYLDPAAGAASFSLFNLIQKPLRPAARALIEQAVATGMRAVKGDVSIEVGGRSEAITLIVEPILPASGKPAHYVLIFQEVETSIVDAELAKNIDDGTSNKELESELRGVKARLQTALDEAEQVNEDLKSINEEFQSLNEELQSSNEELETSKEEMQSINEELQTVNNELNDKNATLHRLNSDLQNLLESTEIAILFLGESLSVRAFTVACTQLFHLRETDRGRPLTEIASRLSYQGLEDDIREVLAKLSVVEREVHTHDSKAIFLMRIRPYRSFNRIVDGVVITFVDITEQKRHAETLGRLAAIVASSHDAIIGHALDGTITSWNRGAETIFGYTAKETIGKPLSILVLQGQPDEMSAVFEQLKRGEAVQNFEASRTGKNGKRIEMSLTVSPVLDSDGKIIAASTVARDMSERAEAELQRATLMAELDHRVKNTLATVHSIATQTVRNTANLEDFGEAFENRLLALSQTHNLLTESHWQGASLREIIATELLPYALDSDNRRFVLEGDDVRLKPSQALALGMAFHELATNAAKYGALSTDVGRLNISWVIENLTSGKGLRLRWSEIGGPPVTPPARRGFGTRLLERGLPHEMAGEVTLEFPSKGVCCTITVPLRGVTK